MYNCLSIISDHGNGKESWSANLIYYSGYTAANLEPIIQKMARMLLDLENSTVIFNKYKAAELGGVSTLVVTKYKQVLEVVAAGIK